MNLYCNILSAYSQKVLLAFYEKGIEFTPKSVNLFDPTDKAAYRNLYPLGKLPLLTGTDIFIPESSIIIEYLENEFPGKGTQLIPTDKTAARRVRLKDRMADLYVNNPMAALDSAPIKPAVQQTPEAAAAALATLDLTFFMFDQELGKNQFAGGDSFSMADCALIPNLFYAQRQHPFGSFPNLSAYFSRMMDRPSMKKVLTELLPALQAMQG